MTYFSRHIVNFLKVVFIASCIMILHSCGKVERDQDDSTDAGNSIVFYMDAEAGVELFSKAIIEDTDYILDNRMPIHVYDENPTTRSLGEVTYQDNGLWYNPDLQWEDKDYVFYAYLVSGASVTNPLSLTLTQPDTYADDAEWEDYLLSYRVSVLRDEHAPVKLQFERITTAVEFYMAGGSLDKVILKEVKFTNVCRKATYSLFNHGTPGDAPGQFGMRNAWNVNLDGTTNVDYIRSWETGYEVPAFEGEGSRYNSRFRFMRFLTVYQPVVRNDVPKYLQVTYEVNGRENTASFDLSETGPSEWQPGHRVRYSMTIDSEVHLQGTIDEWNEVGFIESTLLPDNNND